MRRREMLMGAAGMAASGGAALAEDDLKTQARDAWLYALPLIEIAQFRQRGAGFGMKLNTFFHNKNLADHRARAVTTPNNDTLYASGQIDLSAGPVTITLPGAGERYISLQLMDAYSNSFAVPGTRTTGPEAITIRLIGPNEAAEGEGVIRSPTNHVWALARVLVDGPHDLEAARAVLGGVSMQGPAVEHRTGFADRRADWRAYFDSAFELMKLNPPPVTDQAILRRCGFFLAKLPKYFTLTGSDQNRVGSMTVLLPCPRRSNRRQLNPFLASVWAGAFSSETS